MAAPAFSFPSPGVPHLLRNVEHGSYRSSRPHVFSSTFISSSGIRPSVRTPVRKRVRTSPFSVPVQCSAAGATPPPASSPRGGRGLSDASQSGSKAQTITDLLPPAERAPTPDKEKSRVGVLDVLQLARKHYLILIGGLVAAMVSASILLVTPFALGRVLDAVGGVGDAARKLNRDAFLLMALYAFGALAKLLEVALLRIAGERIVRSLRTDVFGSLMRMDVAKLSESSPGEMLSRLQSDSFDLQNVLTKELPQVFTGSLEAIIGFTMLLIICAPLTPIVALAIPLTVVVATMYGRRTFGFSKMLTKSLATASSLASEQLNGIRVVKAFGRESLSEHKYQSAIDDVYSYGRKVAVADGVMQGWNRFVFTMKTVAILWLGSRFVASGVLSVGGLLSYTIYTSNIAGALSKLAVGWGELIRCGGSLERILGILRTAPEIEQAESPLKSPTAAITAAESIAGNILLDNVSFSYPSRPDSPALRGVHLAIPAGSSVALVGRSGGGKSTVAALLQRFYDPSGGQILLDRKPLNEYDLRFLRERVIGIVPQEPVLFTGTVAENIAFGSADPDGVSEEQIEKAARDAGVMDFVRRLPDGLQTVVGPSQGGLSGGEKQRVMIARCLIKQPRILLLDEATSALDASSEAMVNETIERLMADGTRTLVVITHRLSIAQQCDSIAVLDSGALLESGSHEELLAKDESAYVSLLEVNRKTETH